MINMKVFIFGAGASLGSQGKDPHPDVSSRAPLVDQLFDPQYGDSARNILSDEDFQEGRLGAQSAGSLEKWLTQRWEQIESRKQEITKTSERAFFGRICFYIWNLLQKVSNTYNPSSNGYYLFTKKLKDQDEPFGLMSFNYDTLLDRAVKSQFGVPLISLDDYFRVPLIKPHGSVNWLSHRRDTDPSTYGRTLFDLPGLLSQASNQIFNGGPLNFGNVQVLYPDDPELSVVQYISSKFDSQYFYPLILLPLTVKQYDFLAGFNDKIISKGKEILSTAGEIYLIGYRAADDVIRDMFKEVKSEAVLHVVSLDDSPEIMTRVLDWYPEKLKEGTIFSKGFWDFIQNY